MVTRVAIRIAEQKGRALSAARAIDEPLRLCVDRLHALSIHGFGANAESGGPGADVARRCLTEVRVLVVEVVLADVDHRELPQLRNIQFFVEQSLPQRAFSKKANRNAPVLELLCSEGGAGRNAEASSHNRICSQVARGRVSNVHRAALAAAIAGFLAQQFCEHQVGRGSLGQAVAVAAMRAGNVVLAIQRFAHSHRNRLFAAVQMRQAGHDAPLIKLIHLVLKQPDPHHLAIGVHPAIRR